VLFLFTVLTNSISSTNSLVIHALSVLVCYSSMKSDPVFSVTTVTLFRTLPLRGTATFTEEDLARNDSVILLWDWHTWVVVHWYVSHYLPSSTRHDLTYGS